MAIGLLSALTGSIFNFVSSARQLLENIFYTVAVWPGIQGPFFSLHFGLTYSVEESRSTTSSFYILLVFTRILIRICSLILPVVLYGCETWALTLREERKLRVFENMVLRRIFGPRRDEVTGEWRKLHNEELNDLYSSPNIVWVIKLRR